MMGGKKEGWGVQSNVKLKLNESESAKVYDIFILEFIFNLEAVTKSPASSKKPGLKLIS